MQQPVTIEGLNNHGGMDLTTVAEARKRRSLDPKEVFAGRFDVASRVRPIYNLGVRMPAPTDARSAVKIAGLNYGVEKIKPTIEFNGQVIEHDTYSLVKYDPDRAEPGTHLGYVGKDYRPIQNMDIARVLDECGLTAAWPVTCAGANDSGSRLFIELDAGVHYVKDEPCIGTCLLTEGKDGGAGLRAQYVLYRQVCTNGLMAPVQEAGLNFFLTHAGDITSALELQADILTKLRARQDQLLAKFQKMAETPVTVKQARRIIDAAWPHANGGRAIQAASLKAEWDNLTEAQQKHLQSGLDRDAAWNQTQDVRREAAFGLYEKLNDEFAAIAGTAWAAYNAVTETADWREGGPGERTDESTLFGQRKDEKVRAFGEAMALVGAAGRSRR